jgi:hypothetical protein
LTDQSKPFAVSSTGRIWPPVLLFLLGAGLIAGCTLVLMNQPKGQAGLERKLHLFAEAHPEIHRTTKMVAISNSFERSFGSFYLLTHAIIGKLSPTGANPGTPDAAFVHQSSQSLAFVMAELEKVKMQLNAFSSEPGLQKDLQLYLVIDIDRREQLCRDLTEMLQIDFKISPNGQRARLDQVEALSRNLREAMTDKAIRSIQAIGAAQLSGHENMTEYDELVKESRQLRIASGLALFGRELGFVLIFFSVCFVVVLMGNRRRKQSRPC